MIKTSEKIVLLQLGLLIFLLLLPSFALAQAAGSLVFSLKFSGNSLDVESVSLVPGVPPDYFVEPEHDWLLVNFYGEGEKLQAIKVPDPRRLFLEVAEGEKISGVQLFDGNAPLVFAAPNNPSASRAEFVDDKGERLLTLDYRRALKIEEGVSQPAARQFEPEPQGPDLLPLGIVLGLAGIALGWHAFRKPREPPGPSPEELEKSLDEFLLEERMEKEQQAALKHAEEWANGGPPKKL